MSANLNLTPISVFNMTLSGNGPLVVPYVVDMTLVNEVEADLSQLIANQNMDFISGAYIDNSANTEALILRAQGSNQIITIPPGYQAYMPILAPNEPKFYFSCATIPGILIKVYFYNIPLLPYMWSISGSGGGGGGALTDAELRASPVEATQAPLTVSEFNLSLGGGSESFIGAGLVLNYVLIQNLPGNSDLTINLAGGDASSSGIIIPGGGSYELARGLTNEITVSGNPGDNIIAFVG